MAVEERQMEFGYYQCRMIRQCFHESISAIERFNNLTPAVLQQLPVQAPCVVVGFDHQDSTRDSAVVVEERGHLYTRRDSETINIASVASRMLSSQWRPDSCWLASTVVVVIACATRSLFTRMGLVTHSMAVSVPELRCFQGCSCIRLRVRREESTAGTCRRSRWLHSMSVGGWFRGPTFTVWCVRRRRTIRDPVRRSPPCR
jgi:hypothetical protein